MQHSMADKLNERFYPHVIYSRKLWNTIQLCRHLLATDTAYFYTESLSTSGSAHSSVRTLTMAGPSVEKTWDYELCRLCSFLKPYHILAYKIHKIMSQSKDGEIKPLIICVINTQNEIFRPKWSGVVIHMKHRNETSISSGAQMALMFTVTALLHRVVMVLKQNTYL